MPENVFLRVGVLEDDKYARAGILADLRDAGIEAWLTGDEAEFIRLLNDRPPALVLLDISLGRGDLDVRGLEYIRKVKHDHPGIKCVVLTGSRVLSHFKAALKAKADSFIVKDTEVYLPEIIRRVMAGENIRDVKLLRQLTDEVSQADADDDETLTPRELEVFRVLASQPEITNEGIADELGIAVDTVRTHMKAIFRKLGVENRRDAVIRGRILGLLP